MILTVCFICDQHCQIYTSTVLLCGDPGGAACLTPESSPEGGKDGKLEADLNLHESSKT